MFTTGTPLPAASSAVFPDATVTPAAHAGSSGCSPVSHTSTHTPTRCDVFTFTAFIPELLLHEKLNAMKALKIMLIY
ncbi:hypothetical protein CS559_00636 [Dickeya solani]|uniref:Uncharacterized protein n=2 Tax=Dickeya solani TaxID=1089444 RepID=A0AAV3K473_9GAMM|nr:hypothetical protein [Dickeya solani]ERO55762.1 hypothetical protein A544_2300 [Dickeya solani D s0432-1]NUA41825.1 hypothetical protein [Dickeya solani]RJS01638.1 hypothetical protein CS559_00636 [Dickeya solani]